jgi:hypothetical protein
LGGTVNIVNFSPHGLNDRDQIVFFAQYTTDVNGVPVTSRGIFVASPVYPPLLSDYNADGQVDAADYVVWRDRFGQSGSLPNDPTPGVTMADYESWRAQFGTVVASALGGAVPEPSSSLLTAVSGLVFFRIAGRRRSF